MFIFATHCGVFKCWPRIVLGSMCGGRSLSLSTLNECRSFPIDYSSALLSCSKRLAGVCFRFFFLVDTDWRLCTLLVAINLLYPGGIVFELMVAFFCFDSMVNGKIDYLYWLC